MLMEFVPGGELFSYLCNLGASQPPPGCSILWKPYGQENFKKNNLKKLGCSHHGSVLTILTRIHENTGSIPDLFSGLRIQHCHELWFRSQWWLRFHVGVAVVRTATIAPILPLSWESPYTSGADLKRKKKEKNEKFEVKYVFIFPKTWVISKQLSFLLFFFDIYVQGLHCLPMCCLNSINNIKFMLKIVFMSYTQGSLFIFTRSQ